MNWNGDSVLSTAGLTDTKRNSFDKLFEPRSIAIIGASDQPGNLGGRAIAHLKKFGFPGAVWPVNPKLDMVGGLRCFHNVSALPVPADLAIIAVGGRATIGVLRDCIDRGIRHGIVWAAGFAEVGGAGIALQDELVALCRASGFNLCGPNSIGIINSGVPVTATFASGLIDSDTLIPGRVSMVSQSGGMISTGLALVQAAGYGFRNLVSSGNEAVLQVADFIGGLAQDEGTDVIACYVEGIRDGAAFVTALESARGQGKPVVILKAGVSSASARAAAAHTGALVGDGRVWDAVCRANAVVPVHSHRELLDTSLYLASLRADQMPRGNRVAIVGFGGGGGVLASDLCLRNGLDTPMLASESLRALQDKVPPIASVSNPTDLTPDMFKPQWLAHFASVLDIVGADPNIDAIFMPLTSMARGAMDVAGIIASFVDRSDKPLALSWTMAPADARALLIEKGLYVFDDPANAIAALGRTAAYATARRAAEDRVDPPPLAFDWAAFVPTPSARQIISEDACHTILAAAGLDIARGRLATSAPDAVDAARAIGFPVALKGISAAVTHRADAGLVALGLEDEAAVTAHYARLSAHADTSGVALDGLYVQNMVSGRLELLVSAFRDPVFGVMITCGAGGALAELIDDVTLEPAPFDATIARQVLNRLRVVKSAARIDPGAEVDRLADYVARFSQLAASAPWRQFVLELNPLKWNDKRVAAVDGLLIIDVP